MRFLRIEPHKMFYKAAMNDAPFKTIAILLSHRVRPRNYNNISIDTTVQKCEPNRNTKIQRYNGLVTLYIP